MALAILKFLDQDNTHSRFQVEIGTNRYYTYAIGNGERRSNGLKLLKEIKNTSQLVGPIPESSLGRVTLEIPHTQFDRENRSIQLTSYRDGNRVGMAISEIVTVLPVSTSQSYADSSYSGQSYHSLTLSLALDTVVEKPAMQEKPMPDKQPIETVPFAYKEAPPVSSAMFLGGLVNSAKNIFTGGGAPGQRGGLLNSIGQVASGVLQGATGQPGQQPGSFLGTIGQVAGGLLQNAAAQPGQQGSFLGTLGQVAGGFLQGTAQPGQPGGLANTIGQLAGSLLGGVGGAGTPIPGADGQYPATNYPAANYAPDGTNPQPDQGYGNPDPDGQTQPYFPNATPLLSPGQTYTPPGSGFSPMPTPAPVLSGSSFSPATGSFMPPGSTSPPPPPPLPPSFGSPQQPNNFAAQIAAQRQQLRPVGLPPGSPPPPPLPRPLARARSLSDDSPYAEGMVAPVAALLANPQVMGALTQALPVLAQVAPQITGQIADVLKQTLSPETINAIGANMPTNKLMSMISDGIKEAARMQMESRKQDVEHLEGMTRMEYQGDVADNNFLLQHAQMTMSMSLELAGHTTAINYQRVESVRLDFTDLATLMLDGRSRVLYCQDQDIAFPLKVQTPRPIAKATLQLLVKDATTLDIVIEEKFEVENAASGPLSVVPKLSRDRLSALKPNEDYLVCAALIWSGKLKGGKAKTQIGTSITQLITILGEYAFDRLEGEAKVVPLNDVEKYRNYWHKIWQTDLSKHLRRVNLDCKYYYALEYDRTEMARMETLLKLDEKQGAQQTGKLKTGLILTLDRLNDLLTQISSHPRLTDAELMALKTVDFKNRFTHAARAEVKFKGKAGNTVALWIYPEIKLQRIMLKKAAKTNDNGHVLELAEHPVYFPMLAKVHFIGASH